MHTTIIAAMPTVPADENWADVALYAWILEALDEHQVVAADVTGDHGEGDFSTWAGDVEIDGAVYRLSVHRGVITAAPLA